MRKYYIGIIASLVTFISCEPKVIADFEITNNSGSRIDSLKIGGKKAYNTSFISIRPNEKAHYKADMTSAIQTDSSYIISYKQNNETILLPFQYFINRYPNNKLILIDIQKDTLSMDIEF
ncbi:hypothetical protein [Sediminicola arcticus]|jgi:hypothetical protein|uniref:Lipoprotein n=1 Tax=Sediminicola arcticus TaxID=1574308 RepID=A0ABV2SRY9_9FLAO